MSYADQSIYRYVPRHHRQWQQIQEGKRCVRCGRMEHRLIQLKKFGVVNRYDLSKEFPALTLRRTAIKSCTDELLWIWQKKSNNIHDLNSHIWDSWADERWIDWKSLWIPAWSVKHQYKEGMFDQVDRVIYDLKNNPYSRRIMTNIYVHQDLHEMNLYPCAYSMTFNVTKKEGHEKLTLNANAKSEIQ